MWPLKDGGTRDVSYPVVLPLQLRSGARHLESLLKLMPEEYCRGLLSWSIDSPAVVLTATSTAPDGPTIWAPPVADPMGSVVISPPGRYARVRIEAHDRTALQRPWEARWERAGEDRFGTFVFNHLSPTVPLLLEHVPNFGVFHRLVVRTPFLELTEGSVLRLGDLVVRFIVGPISGDLARPFHTVQYAPDRVTIEGGPIGNHREEGRFIEIVAPGGSADEAEFNAYRTLGLIAACVGPHAVGEVLFSERHENRRDPGGGTVVTTTTGKNPWFVTAEVIDMVHRALPRLEETTRVATALSVALRWYERGQRGDTPLDELMSYFIGIESILTAYWQQHESPEEAQKRRKRYDRIEDELLRLLDGDTAALKRLRDKMVEPTLPERMRFYVAERGWEPEVVEQFGQLAGKRSKLFHGSAASIRPEDARRARRLLGRLIRTELGLAEAMDWESLPLVFPVRSEGRAACATADLEGTIFAPDED